MAVVRKFEFDTSFDARPKPPPAPAPVPEIEIEAPPPPSFSTEELEAARNAARHEGRAEGEAAARASLAQKLADAGDRIALCLRDSAAGQAQAIDRIERQAAETLLTLLRKLFPLLAARGGTDEIAELLDEAFSVARDQPRLIVRCARPVLDEIRAMATGAAQRSGFEGRVSVIGDDALEEQDCRIEWAEGGVERTPGRMLAAIDEIIERGIAAFDQRHGTADASVGPDEESRR